ncbi:MAG: FAD-dependent oxidoreductase [Candidatus Thermoplasmatota archaeon]|nr:FAD-dependent oxidoreductase [Candidatus Thermoplasmatota archaeon]
MAETNDIVIIGCGAGGATAAQFAKKTDRKAQVTIFESSSFSQYSKCGIPYAISGEIPKIMNLIEFSEEWFQKARIDLHLNTTVTEIDLEKKIITAEKKDGSIIKKQYTSLILATGANPAHPPIKNIYEPDSKKLRKNVFTVRTIQDAKQISAATQSEKKATVVGAGLIGLEMADTLHKKGLKVTIVEALPTILTNILDKDMTKLILNTLEESVTVHLNTFATEIKTNEEEKLSSVFIKEKNSDEQKEIPTDLLIIAAGIKPETTLAEKAGCKIGETKAIKVNNHAKTTKEDIYAVGDCTEYIEFVTGKPVPIGLGSIAVRQGIAAGTNAAGGTYELPKGVLQTATSEFFNIEIGSVGPSLHTRKDKKTITAKHKGLSKPEYFPGGKSIMMKTIVDLETGKVIGAQAVGENAAQRVNTYATAILSELHIDTFRKLETAYAPPIAPTLDVVTLAADIASLKWHRKK